MPFETKATIASFGGTLHKLTHHSPLLNCSMPVNLYLPPQATTQTVPVLYFLSGLTCTPDNCAEKGFLQAHAAQHGIAIVYPDTSPRGLNIEGEDKDWDFGTGAGFYVDATEEPWSGGYKMYSYIVDELPGLLYEKFAELDGGRVGIMGHSMGGHGALMIYLRNAEKFRSVSALSPIANPVNCPWGQKAFGGYLGKDEESWKEYDATELVRKFKGPLDILIDVGDGDDFYKKGQLLPEKFVEAAKESGHGEDDVKLRMQPGYDHSYFFISTFGADHVAHAAKYLLA